MKDEKDIPDYLSGEFGPDEVPEDYLQPEDMKLQAKISQPHVDAYLQLPSDGLYGYYRDDRKYGFQQTVDALLEVGRIWHARGNNPRIGIGDISKQGGGQISGHASHRKGIDIDIRPLKKNGEEGPVTYQQAAYARELTQELSDLIHANGKLAVQFILFNDPAVKDVRPYRNHDNHLHVRHWMPGIEPALPILSQGSKHPTVRELQRRLNFWFERTEPDPLIAPLSVDGDFGDNTHVAVLTFQRISQMTEDGRVGNQTWGVLPTN